MKGQPFNLLANRLDFGFRLLEFKGMENLIDNDPFLNMFVDFANKNKMNVPVFLTVNGNLITGEIISEAAYFKETQTIFSKAPMSGNPEVVSEMRTIMTEGMGNFAESSKTSDKDTDEDEVPSYTFIHLRKAKAIQGGGVVVDIGVWRGHLNSVTGFSLGTIG